MRFPGLATELQNAVASAARVFALIDEEPQTPEAEQAIELQEADGRVELSHVALFLPAGHVSD